MSARLEYSPRLARHRLSEASMSFELPANLEASRPPEARGLKRDQVRLMISHYGSDIIRHHRFDELPGLLDEGDILVINTSKTLNAAVPVEREEGEQLWMHLSNRLTTREWVVEFRHQVASGTVPFQGIVSGERMMLPESVSLEVLRPFAELSGEESKPGSRLWLVRASGPPLEQHSTGLLPYLNRNGKPIRYNYVEREWPIRYYQTVFAQEPGSAEMPSAGRAFSERLVARLVARGIQFVPVLLHTGVASAEAGEAPYPEFYRVDSSSAERLNCARRAGRRIIAVGTTVVRALETVAGRDGLISPGSGWTDVIITPRRGLRVVDGLLTGLHEPRASHLAMLSALAGEQHLNLSYQAALKAQYLWHEFGDLHLILP